MKVSREDTENDEGELLVLQRNFRPSFWKNHFHTDLFSLFYFKENFEEP